MREAKATQSDRRCPKPPQASNRALQTQSIPLFEVWQFDAAHRLWVGVRRILPILRGCIQVDRGE